MLLDRDTYGDVVCSQIPVILRTEYEMQFYLIEGSKDHGVSNMFETAADHFETVNAPDKEMIYVDGGHGSPILRCDRFVGVEHAGADNFRAVPAEIYRIMWQSPMFL